MNSERRTSPLNPRLSRLVTEPQEERLQLLYKWRFLNTGLTLIIIRFNKPDISYRGVTIAALSGTFLGGVLLFPT